MGTSGLTLLRIYQCSLISLFQWIAKTLLNSGKTYSLQPPKIVHQRSPFDHNVFFHQAQLVISWSMEYWTENFLKIYRGKLANTYRSSHQRCSIKKMFSKILQYSWQHTCVGVFFWKSSMKFWSNILKNHCICPSRSFRLATVLVIISVIPEGHVIKHIFKIKKNKYDEKWESATRKRYTMVKRYTSITMI